MKQNITKEQLTDLTERAERKYADYCLKKGWYTLNPIKNMPNGDGTFTEMVEPARLHILSIGEMIEFLEDNSQVVFGLHRRLVDWKIYVGDRNYGKILGGELCDHLWEAVKEILESTHTDPEES